jgi:hypothetical protein
MAQPFFRPTEKSFRVRASYRLRTPPKFELKRVGEIRPEVGDPEPDYINSFPGPDQGFGLLLIENALKDINLSHEENKHDVISAFGALVTKRAAYFGRAPIVSDVKYILLLFGYQTDKPINKELESKLIAKRRLMFLGAAHSYEIQRKIAHTVSLDVLSRDINYLKNNLEALIKEII